MKTWQAMNTLHTYDIMQVVADGSSVAVVATRQSLCTSSREYCCDKVMHAFVWVGEVNRCITLCPPPPTHPLACPRVCPIRTMIPHPPHQHPKYSVALKGREEAMAAEEREERERRKARELERRSPKMQDPRLLPDSAAPAGAGAGHQEVPEFPFRKGKPGS